MIATDYDREGELIGLEALEEILDANPACRALSPRATIRSAPDRPHQARPVLRPDQGGDRAAFYNLVELSEPLARAGEARQDIDLIWGATLTRFVSLATGRFGSQFLSVGRVQSPTLGLIVERELERRAHVAKPYWEVFARSSTPTARSRRTTRSTSSGTRARPRRPSPARRARAS